MLNTRGNTFSRVHETYPVVSPRFWEFAMDEMASEDVPAVVEYMRNVTGAPKVGCVTKTYACPYIAHGFCTCAWPADEM